MADLKALMQRFYDEVFNKGDVDAIDALLADDFVEHEQTPGLTPDREGVKELVRMFRSAFPDLHATVEDMIQEGDKVVVRGRMTGTHQGEFMGIPETGRSIDVGMIDIVELRGEQVTAHWGVTDVATMMEQLGVMEPPG